MPSGFFICGRCCTLAGIVLDTLYPIWLLLFLRNGKEAGEEIPSQSPITNLKEKR